jgi:hypothetical protein
VSEAARETCPKGPGHGACVSAVARTDVGKPAASGGTESTEDDAGEDEAAESAGPPAGPPEGKGPGNSQGRGHDK